MGFAFDKPLVWIIILVIVLLIFGAGKLPEIGRSFGRSIKEFKDETQNGMTDSTTIEPAKSVETPSRETVATAATTSASAPQIRRRIIKHPDGREEIIEEPM